MVRFRLPRDVLTVMTDQRIRPKASAYALSPNISLAKASHVAKGKGQEVYSAHHVVMERNEWILLLQGPMIQPSSPDHVIVSSPTGRVAVLVPLSVCIASYTFHAEESTDSRPALVPGGFCASQAAPGGCDSTVHKD